MEDWDIARVIADYADAAERMKAALDAEYRLDKAEPGRSYTFAAGTLGQSGVDENGAFGEGNDYIREVAEHASVPVISMQCDVYHPCQILADYLTISERFSGETRGLKLGVAWTSAPNYVRPLSVPQRLILMMPPTLWPLPNAMGCRMSIRRGST